MKNSSKNSSIILIAAKEKNLSNKAIKESFLIVKTISLQNFKVNSLKILSLINTIKGLQKKYLKQSIKMIKIRKFDSLSKIKALFSIFNLFIKKRKAYLT